MKPLLLPHPAFLELIERAVLPALLERFLAKHGLAPSVARPTTDATVTVESRSL